MFYSSSVGSLMSGPGTTLTRTVKLILYCKTAWKSSRSKPRVVRINLHLLSKSMLQPIIRNTLFVSPGVIIEKTEILQISRCTSPGKHVTYYKQLFHVCRYRQTNFLFCPPEKPSAPCQEDLTPPPHFLQQGVRPSVYLIFGSSGSSLQSRSASAPSAAVSHQ